MGEEVDPEKIEKNLDAMAADSEAGEQTRTRLREAIAFKKYEFDAHGVEMNQRYISDAVVTDGQPRARLRRRPRAALPADDVARRAAAACLGASRPTAPASRPSTSADTGVSRC